MELQGATVAVAGLGVSGRCALTVLDGVAGRVVSVDERQEEADYHDGNAVPWDSMDALVVSPVFAPSTSWLRHAESQGVAVMSEVELGWRMRVPSERTGKPAAWIGITGTNGKTSTTQMVSAMLTACGLDAPAVGNIGVPVSGAACEPQHDVLCVELSSFQLHYTHGMALDCAAITNIADDHLDWHGGMEGYVRDKARVYDGVRRALVYNADDVRVSRVASQAHRAEGCRMVGVTLGEPTSGQLGVCDGWIVDCSGVAGGKPREPVRVLEVARLEHLREPDGTVYPHLLADALVALALVLGYGADCQLALDGLVSFAPGGHRIATVAQTRLHDGANIRFVDDSKATNAHAAAASLHSFAPGSVVWLAGGLAKGARFSSVVRECADRLCGVVVLGVDGEPIESALADEAPDVPVRRIDPEDRATVMRRAVEAAGALARESGVRDAVVLLAPACASMDQFVSYADRGNQFAQCAQEWVKFHG